MFGFHFKCLYLLNTSLRCFNPAKDELSRPRILAILYSWAPLRSLLRPMLPCVTLCPLIAKITEISKNPGT